jgi:uncharacterized protein
LKRSVDSPELRLTQGLEDRHHGTAEGIGKSILKVKDAMSTTLHEEVGQSVETVTFPIEVHVFQYDDQNYAFDVRNYTILRLDDHGAAVLSRMREQNLGEIVAELAYVAPAKVVRAHYLRFLEMILSGVLSSAPVRRPARPPFNRLVLMLAGGCNMGCAYCFEKDVPIYQNVNRLSHDKADEILDWFFAHQEGDNAHIQLYGGEPLLNWPVLKHVVERMESWAVLNDKELSKYLITNGTLLDPERIAYLKSHGITIQVSADGDAETHNRLRVFKSGKPTMERILPNIRELSRQGADFNLRAVLTRQNKDPEAVVNGLRSLGAENVSFEVVATDNPDAQFSDEDWEEFHAKFGDHVNSGYKTWKELPDEMQTTIIRLCERRRVFYGCGAGISEVTVAPDGSIYECQRLYREPYSNVKQDRSPTDLASALLTMVDDRPICQDCWARYLCGGGCMHQSHIGHGKDDPLPQYCVMKRTLVEASIVKIDEIRRANGVIGEKRTHATK